MRIKSAGFTLIELLVVIAIIGLLASTVLATVGTAREKARDARRATEVRQTKTALELYFNSNNGYPPCRTSTGTAVADNSGCYLGHVVQYDLSQYMTSSPHDPQYSYVTGDYQYVRATGSQGYGIRIQYEKLGPGFCKTGVNVVLGWWGTYVPGPPASGVPLCEGLI